MLKAQIIGNLGSDAVVKQIGENTVINFSIAHNERIVNRDGVATEKTTWISCAMWRKSGQSVEVAKYLCRGQQVYIEGTPSVMVFRDESGQHRPDFKVKVRELQLIGSNTGRA
jgi:single-strand DNA-binding protein